MERLNLFVAATAFLGATAIVSYIAVTADGPVADTALGALIALVSAGAGFFLRGRVQSPAEDEPTPPSAAGRGRRQSPNEFEPSHDAPPEPTPAPPHESSSGENTGWSGGPGMDAPEPRRPQSP